MLRGPGWALLGKPTQTPACHQDLKLEGEDTRAWGATGMDRPLGLLLSHPGLLWVHGEDVSAGGKT